MTDLRFTTEQNFHFHAAGHVWLVPQVRFVVLPDGKKGLQQSEIKRIHAAIANQLCGHAGEMSSKEFEFLCSINSTSLSEVADYLQVNKSTVSRWKSGDRPVPPLAANAIRRKFWLTMFGQELLKRKVTLELALNEAEFLNYAKCQAIAEELTIEISEEAA